jgi:hypothetical protein
LSADVAVGIEGAVAVATAVATDVAVGASVGVVSTVGLRVGVNVSRKVDVRSTPAVALGDVAVAALKRISQSNSPPDASALRESSLTRRFLRSSFCAAMLVPPTMTVLRFMALSTADSLRAEVSPCQPDRTAATGFL